MIFGTGHLLILGILIIFPLVLFFSYFPYIRDQFDHYIDELCVFLHYRTSRLKLSNRPRRLILVRHGESEGNIDKNIYQHIPDNLISLTEKGMEQAKTAGENLAQLIAGETVLFYVSPFLRSQQTFHIISRYFDPAKYRVREDPRIREQEWGNFQQPHHLPSILADRERVGTFFYRFSDGESGADVFDRVSSFMESMFREMANDSPVQNMVIVSHGLFMRLFLMRFFRWNVEQFALLKNPENTEFYLLQRDFPHSSFELKTKLRINAHGHNKKRLWKEKREALLDGGVSTEAVNHFNKCIQKETPNEKEKCRKEQREAIVSLSDQEKGEREEKNELLVLDEKQRVSSRAGSSAAESAFASGVSLPSTPVSLTHLVSEDSILNPTPLAPKPGLIDVPSPSDDEKEDDDQLEGSLDEKNLLVDSEADTDTEEEEEEGRTILISRSRSRSLHPAPPAATLETLDAFSPRITPLLSSTAVTAGSTIPAPTNLPSLDESAMEVPLKTPPSPSSSSASPPSTSSPPVLFEGGGAGTSLNATTAGSLRFRARSASLAELPRGLSAVDLFASPQKHHPPSLPTDLSSTTSSTSFPPAPRIPLHSSSHAFARSHSLFPSHPAYPTNVIRSPSKSATHSPSFSPVKPSIPLDSLPALSPAKLPKQTN